MGNQPPNLYEEERKKVYPSVILEEIDYGRGIETLVVVCTDIGIIDSESKTLYLARRALRPASGRWWFIGGRIFVGEPEKKSAQRCFKRETGLLIEECRFQFVCMNRYFFKDRQQAPHEVGCDSLCYTFAIQLTSKEREQIVLDSREYQGGSLREFKREELQSGGEVWLPLCDFYTKVFES